VTQPPTPAFGWSAEQKLADMNSLGVDVHAGSTFIGYHTFPTADGAVAACRDASGEVAGMMRQHPCLTHSEGGPALPD
jgi:hypothetical protein